MRTACLLTVEGEVSIDVCVRGCPESGMCVQGVCPRGCTLPGPRGRHASRPRGTLPDQRHPHSGQTDACENITLPQISFAGGKVVFAFSFAQCKWALTRTSQGENSKQVFRIRSRRPINETISFLFIQLSTGQYQFLFIGGCSFRSSFG